MKIVKCSEEVNEAIRLFTSEQFLNLKPVIAGGFVAWLIEMDQSKPRKIVDVIAARKAYYKLSHIEILGETCQTFGVAALDIDILNKRDFGDVDSWFLTSNQIWGKHPANLLVKNTYRAGLEGIVSQIGYKDVRFQSLWANSLARPAPGKNSSRKDAGDEILQIITQPYDSVESILESFDLLGCKVAWHKDHFWISEDFIDVAVSRRIKISQTYWNDSDYFQKIQTILRAFKYYKRTGMSFSQDAYEKAVQTFRDVIDSDFTKEMINKNNTGSSSFNTQTVIDELAKILPGMTPKLAHEITTYGHQTSRNMLEDLHSKLLNSFSLLMVQTEFKEEDLPFFIGSGWPRIEALVRGGMEYASGRRHEKRALPITLDNDGSINNLLDKLT